MTMNARTYQVLSVVRKLAQEDVPVSQERIAAYIADLRKSAPSLYDRAYISPSGLKNLLFRLRSPERLLKLNGNGGLDFTPKGSQIADLFHDVDTCTSNFQEFYKREVVLAALRQRQRLDMGFVSAGTLAEITGMSAQSVREGLALLEFEDLLEKDESDRAVRYELKGSTPVMGFLVQEEEEEEDVEPVEDVVKEALADFDESHVNLFQTYSLEQILNEPLVVVPGPLAKETSRGLSPWEEIPLSLQESLACKAEALGMTLEAFLQRIDHDLGFKMREAVFP